ncbi:glycosyltransferase family 4 protein [Providencia sp. PROV188]|uniref:glycosyltransferase family 4 protein n=1 Tax=Providencia sp. PROV188 TaxID=2939731 RepID=UPI0022DD0B28|nr:glycosyltransferase family 4 protein [Providencia sp. PROV188]WBM60751.1 glycosyltransferase family 4 protein [Providencia sp. PROV188]
MKILLLNTSFYPQIGGVENSLRSISDVLSKEGHSITIISSDSGDHSLPDKEYLYGATLFRYRHSGFIRGFFNLLKKLKNIRKNDYDIIISRNMLTTLALILLRFKQFHYIVPGIHKYQNNISNKKNQFRFKLECMIDRFCLTFSPNVYVFSRNMETQVFNLTKRNDIKNIVPGIDTIRFNPANLIEKNKLRDAYGLPKNKTIILGLGRFSCVKNYSTLIECMPHVGNEYILLLVGDGDEKKNYEVMIEKLKISNRVFIFNKTLEPEIFYKLSDLFCLSSTYEPFGQVLLEAISCNLHLVALNNTSPNINTATNEIFNKYPGLVNYVSENTPRAFAHTINSLKLDNTAAHQIERENFLKNHSWLQLINEIRNNSKR